MSNTYFQKNIPLTAAQIADTEDLSADEGQVVLCVELVYSKDARPRGLTLLIFRKVITDMGFITMPFSNYNRRLHIQPLDRKNDKAGKAFAALIESRIDQIAEIALASTDPEWEKIKNLVNEPVTA